eukprot:TRINITY_DN230_c0_g1_i5.p1 TRINITY_DN230_c0_g1~~TRINITY_DN230_c0_g1_i5.p1  ORF type:complete len:893 (-),score=221.42 TRINITY_DN230_c0_g1_i5:371-2971(-)
MAESLAPNVQKLLVAGTSRPAIKKKSALCLLKLFRKYPEIMPTDTWGERIINLLNDYDMGVLLSVCSLLLGMIQTDPQGLERAVPRVIQKLSQIVLNKAYEGDYLYHDVPCPWLQVKYLRILQHFPAPEDIEAKKKLRDCLQKIISTSDFTKDNNHNNAVYAILFEAINTIIHLESEPELLAQTVSLLGRFVSSKETNIRYLGLDSMAQLAQNPEYADQIRKHQAVVISSLRDADISIRRRALDLLYNMCDRSNSKEIVSELLGYLEQADISIKEELVIKSAVLAEQYATDYSWYIDVILQLIALSGDFVSDDVWFRAVQIVTNNDDLQKYAATNIFQALSVPACHETVVKVAGYILGEFGNLIINDSGSSAREQFTLLHSKFKTATWQTKALLLNTFIKFHDKYPALRREIEPVLNGNTSHINAEIQQRACEYAELAKLGERITHGTFELLPAFPEKESALHQRLKQRQNESKRVATVEKEKEKDEEPKVQLSPASQQSTAGDLLGLDDVPVPASTKPSLPSGIPVASSVSAAADPLADLLMGSGPIPTQPSNSFAAAPKPASSSTATDLLSDLADVLSSTSVSPAPALSASTPAYIPPSNVLAAMTPALSASSSAILTPSAAPNPAADQFFQRLCLYPDGVLYEDASIQIGVKSEYHGALGRLSLFYGNKNRMAALLKFTVSVQPFTAVKFQLSPVPDTIQPQQQSQQMCSMECTQEFLEPPLLNIQYIQEGKINNLVVKLPVVATKFVESLPMQGGDFFKRWKEAGEAAPLEYQGVQKSAKATDVPMLTKVLTQGFKLYSLANVDPNPANLVLSGQFCTTSGKTPVLVRIETNAAAQMLRVTARTPSGIVTSAVKTYLLPHLS